MQNPPKIDPKPETFPYRCHQELEIDPSTQEATQIDDAHN